MIFLESLGALDFFGPLGSVNIVCSVRRRVEEKGWEEEKGRGVSDRDSRRKKNSPNVSRKWEKPKAELTRVAL